MRTKTLTEQDLLTYRRRLREMAARLGEEVAELEDEAFRPTGTEAGGASAADPDPAAQAAAEGVAVALLDAEGHTLADVTVAIDRLDRGAFGRCDGCGRPIAKARLDALPYARRCIRCARVAEGPF
ncbi:MAG: TraR/DksA C4-type zinc finger protein [Gemmataceae bacterium]|nr:TraR/DksA C4-type zinc finger protein [Gemmataceae bacterium]